ncbi:MAG: glycosyltransferase family 4 protein [Prevotella sp.]|nr:glycosyltransferase family 4 protein [Prevotella sp.]
MKIVFLHHANVCRGGIERMLATKANWLVEHEGHEVVMLTYEQNGVSFPYTLSPKVRMVDLGIHLYDIYKAPLPFRYFFKLKRCRQLSVALRHFLDEERPDLVVCTDKDYNELNALSDIRQSESIAIEAHTGMVDHLMQVRQTTNIIRKRIAVYGVHKLQRVASRFDAMIALTADDARLWSPYVKTVVIPNYYSEPSIRPADLTLEKKRVIAVGRLNYQKGQDLLLQAWQQVERRHPDWHLDIYGDGEEHDNLTRLQAALHLHHVTIHPSTPDIFTHYVQSDFLVCSSRWESFGLIVIEAMSCGLPVVSFDCDNGPRNVIRNGEDGWLVEDGNIGELAAKMNQMIEQPALRSTMGAHALKHVTRFQKEPILRQYADFYRQLAEARGAH